MTDSRLLAGRHCFGLSSVLLTVCPHYEGPTITGTDGNMDIILAGTDVCYPADRGQSAWPTEERKALKSLVWSGGTHPHPGGSKIAELCSCQLLQRQILLIRPPAPPETGINSMLHQNLYNFRQGGKKAAKE